MNEFIEALIGLRNKAGGVAKGTLDNILGAGDRFDEVRDFERTKNQDIIAEKFGRPEQYRQFLEEQPPLPETPGEKLGGFLERLVQLRGGDNR